MNKRIPVKIRVLIILLAIFVFLVAALSVSICMFVKAANVAAQAERLERVVRETDSLGEVLKASDGDTKAGAELLPEHCGAEVSENSITLYYTEKFEPSSKALQISCADPADSRQRRQLRQLADQLVYEKREKKAFYKMEFKSIAQ